MSDSPPETDAPAPPSTALAAPDIDHEGLRSVFFYAVLGGLCPLIPIPFLDDLIIGVIRRNMVRAILGRAGLKPTDDQVATLTHEDRGGCLMGCLTMVVVYPLKKIFRKIVYVLAVKDCADVASKLLHEGLLLRYAIASGLITTEHLHRYQHPRLEHVRAATVAACEEIDTRPINQLLRRLFSSSKGLMTDAARMLGSSIKARRSKPRDAEAVSEAIDAVEGAERDKLEGQVDQLDSELKEQAAYFKHLEGLFDRHLQAAEGSS